MKKSVIIEFDETAYQELKQLAQERGTELEEALTEAVKAYWAQRNAYVNDPFFQIGKVGSSGLGDLAEAHDEYLYGTEENR